MSNSDAIQRIDKFIKQLDDHDIILESHKLGKSYGYYQKTKSLFGYKDQYVGTFPEMISKHLAFYQQTKDATDDSTFKVLAIDNALYWINLAYSNNIVNPSDGIFRKYDEALDNINQLIKHQKELEDELQTVSAELLDSEADRRSLKHQLEDLKKAKKES